MTQRKKTAIWSDAPPRSSLDSSAKASLSAWRTIPRGAVLLEVERSADLVEACLRTRR
jgi:hypothetical protein